MHRMCREMMILSPAIAFVITAMPLYAARPQTPDQQVQIVAAEMCCQGCARKVSAQLYAARGVKDVQIDMDSRTVTVTLPKPNAPMLGQLWQTVAEGDGGPTKLTTPEASYTLAVAQAEQATAPQANGNLYIVIDNLHCKGCAQKIAAQLYATKGVTQVSVDLQQETLIVQTRPDVVLSPWMAMDAVGKANERPLSLSGRYGTISITYAKPQAPKNHDQANSLNGGGIRR